MPNAFAANPLLIGLPAAWLVVRRYRNKELSELRRWLDAAAHDLRITDVWEAANEYLVEGPATVADLSHWAMSDLPTGEAHFIDTNTDIVWAVILLSMLQDPTGLRRVSQIGEGIYSRRDAFFRVMADIETRSDDVARDLAVPDGNSRLKAIRAFLEDRISEYERRVRARVRETPISERAVEAFADAARSAWRTGQPRALLESSGAVQRIPTRRPPRATKLVVYRLERKDLFIEDSGYVEATWKQIGRHFGEAFVRGESQALVATMPKARPSARPIRDIHAAIRSAVGRLRRIGIEPTHIVIPPAWRLRVALGVSDNLRMNTIHATGLTVYEWWECPPNQIFVISLPTSIKLVQYVSDEDELVIEVREIGDHEERELREEGIEDVEGDPSESPSERIRGRAWLRMRENVRFIVRSRQVVQITLPHDLRTD